MTTQEIKTASILLKYAKQDVNSAKRNGQHGICETSVGNIENGMARITLFRKGA